MGNSAGSVGMDLALKKAKGEIGSKLMDETFASDGVNRLAGQEATRTAANSTFKKAFGYATLFIDFVDAYSKAVKAANLENVRQNLEVCPHLGQCENNGHAMKMADNTTATVWQAPDSYWYFHPQMNYRVRHARQIYRSTLEGGWRIESPGRCHFQTVDCLACVEAHSGQ